MQDKISLFSMRSASEIENSHSYTGNGHEGTESVANHSCTSENSSESSFMGLHETGPDCPDVRGCTNDEKHDNNHTVKIEECALSLLSYLPLLFICINIISNVFILIIHLDIIFNNSFF